MINKTNKFRWRSWKECMYVLTVMFCSSPKLVIQKKFIEKNVYTIIVMLDFIGFQQKPKYLIHIVSTTSTTSTYQQYQQ